MIKAQGSINREYETLEDLQADAIRKCLNSGETIFINYSTKPAHKSNWFKRLIRNIVRS